MRVAERATPVAAVIAAIATVGCCLPLGFVGAAGLAGASLWLEPVRPWLLGGAAVLLGASFVQLYLRKQCRKRSPVSQAIFWLAAVTVLLIILFPQLVAGLLAG